jgi:starvation-inducible DNA-binding protein
MGWTVLGDAPIEGLRADLQASVDEALWLTLLGKQLHWNLVGPTFLSAHAQLDDIVEHARSWTDDLAERLVTLGGVADGSPAAAARGELGSLPISQLAIEDALGTMADALASFARRLRDRAAAADDRDLATQDLYVEVLRAVEKDLWMVRAQLEHPKS